MKKKKREIKKRLEDFIKDETGYISKDKILKIGVGTIAALSIMSAFSSSVAQMNTHSSAALSHSNTATVGTTTAACPDITHGSHASHGSHTSY
jgi:hypothetical protein